MTGNDDFRIRPGRIRSTRAARTKPFLAQALQAAQKAGGLSRGGTRRGSTFGRGRAASLAASRLLGSRARGAIVKARVVRRMRSAGALRAHIGYLQRDGVTRDGSQGKLFDAAGEGADGRAFAERCKDDRHHFRFIVSPDDAGELSSLRTFTRELMDQASRDLGTRLDWVAIDHWNTEHPHVHILVRGRVDDGKDLVISRDYISSGFRARAGDLVTRELGPRSELEIRQGLEAETAAERWTRIDRVLAREAGAADGVIDLRPNRDAAGDLLREIRIGRMRTLERLGLAEPAGPARWELATEAEQRLRELGERGDIIKRLHKSLTKDGATRAPSSWALEGERHGEPVVGRLIARGLDDELRGSAFAVVDGIDGRVHHLKLPDIESASDGPIGGIVELRRFEDARGRQRIALAVRSDLNLDQQVAAEGATWLDRRLVAREGVEISHAGFGAEVRAALDRRIDALAEQGLVRRDGDQVTIGRNLVSTLRSRELDAVGRRLVSETGRAHLPAEPGEPVTGTYRRRLSLASGRFAMIDNGLGFQLVPWIPSLERELGRQVNGIAGPGGVEWRQARHLALTSRYLRYDAHRHAVAWIAVECCYGRASALGMSATKILWGQLLFVSAVVLAFVWAATEWTAWRLGFQPQLGPAWLVIGHWPVYQPLAFFIWWFKFDAYAPKIFIEGGGIAAGGGISAMGVAVFLSVWRAREARHVTTYGSARWADRTEVRRAGLLGPDGVVLGRLDGSYLRHDGPEHVLCFAPTRSGKGVGLVIPTLLTWPYSTIVHDIKGENFQLTSGWRARFGSVLLFDPTNPVSAAYNPLLEIRKGDCEVRDAQNIADILVDPEGALERRNHWEKTSHSLLVGAILHVLYAEADKTLAGVANFLSDPSRPIEATLNAMLATPHLGERVHPVMASAARELLNKSENERSGVLSTTMSFLGLYRDPVVAKVTGRSDWRIRDLVDGDRPISLYLVIPPSDIARTKPLLRLVLNQIGRRLTESLDTDRRRQKLLLMLDEFAALGRLDFFESQLAFMAGYGIRSFLITQSLNQLERAYGPNHAILDNCHIRIAFSTNDERTAKRVSDALGTATEMRAMKNYAGHRLSPWLGHLMVSRQETSRSLLTPGEVMQFPPNEAIVMISGVHPVRARKIRYYEDTQFKNRILKPSCAVPIDKIACPDEWSGRGSIPPSVKLLAALTKKARDQNGGIRREPELPQQGDVVVTAPLTEYEFDAAPDEDDADAVQAASLNRSMQRLARAVSLDPDDKMGL